jgi:hypothetical protein
LEGTPIHSRGRRDHCLPVADATRRFHFVEETAMIRPAVAVATLVLLTATDPCLAGQNENVRSDAAAPASNESNNRLMIINGNSGRVIYDDGRDDLFCVTRRYFVGWDCYGRRLYRRVMGCR